MASNLFLMGHASPLPVVDSLLVCIVELAATYLVHSTLFLLAGWALLPVVLWLFSRRRPDGQGCPSYAPALTERVWKLMAVLALVTAPLSVLTGWSRPAFEWSFLLRPSHAEAVVVLEPLDNAAAELRETLPATTAPADEASATRPLIEGSTALTNEESPHRELAQAPAQLAFDPAFEESVGRSVAELRAEAALVALNRLDGETLETPLIASSEWPLAAEQTGPTLSSAEQIGATSLHSVESQPNTAKLAWLGCGLIAWFGVSFGRMFAKGVTLHRRLARCQPASGELSKTLNKLLGRGHSARLLQARADKTEEPLTLTLSPPRRGARGQEAITEPFACGLFRWTIVLPAGIEQKLSPSEQRALLAHEIAHLVRRDPWWLWLGEVLCTCFAFQPLNFLARRRWQQMAELLCDDWAVERQVSATSLASCLTKLAEWRLDRRATLMGLTAVGRSGSLTQRIEWLLRDGRASEPQRPHARMAATLTTFSFGLLVGLYGPRLTLIVPAEANETQPVSTVDATFTDDNVTSVADDLAAQLWNDMELELHHTLSELAQLESRLATDPDPAVAALANRLRIRVASLKERIIPCRPQTHSQSFSNGVRQ